MVSLTEWKNGSRVTLLDYAVESDCCVLCTNKVKVAVLWAVFPTLLASTDGFKRMCGAWSHYNWFRYTSRWQTCTRSQLRFLLVKYILRLISNRSESTSWAWEKPKDILKSKASKIRGMNARVGVQHKDCRGYSKFADQQSFSIWNRWCSLVRSWTYSPGFKVLSLCRWVIWLVALWIELTGSFHDCTSFLSSKYLLDSGNCWLFKMEEQGINKLPRRAVEVFHGQFWLLKVSSVYKI